MRLLFEKESFEIRGAFYEVYKEKGACFTEPIYHECLIEEFRMRGLPAVSEPELEISYKGNRLRKTLRPDFVCFGKIIVEIKGVKKLTDEHRAQVHNYLRATGFELGFLADVGHFSPIELERIVLSRGQFSSQNTQPSLQ